MCMHWRVVHTYDVLWHRRRRTELRWHACMRTHWHEPICDNIVKHISNETFVKHAQSRSRSLAMSLLAWQLLDPRKSYIQGDHPR